MVLFSLFVVFTISNNKVRKNKKLQRTLYLILLPVLFFIVYFGLKHLLN